MIGIGIGWLLLWLLDTRKDVTKEFIEISATLGTIEVYWLSVDKCHHLHLWLMGRIRLGLGLVGVS